MNVLSGFPSPRLPDYDNNLVSSVLYGELVTHRPWSQVLFSLTNRGQRTGRTHQFIESIHLPVYWQLFSSLEYFVILIGMRQVGERVFLAILLWHQEYDVNKIKITTYNGPSNLFRCHFSWREAE